MAKTVVGFFENAADAEAAMRDVQRAGFTTNNASLIQTASGRLTSIFEQLGIPQDDAQLYLQGLRNGGSLIVLQQLSDDEGSRAADILDRHHVVDIDHMSRSSTSSQATTTATTSTSGQIMGGNQVATSGSGRRNFYQGGEAVIPIVEEELRIGKREVESGGVRVNVGVEETPVSEQVSLRDEEVRVERRPIGQPLDAQTAAQAFREGSFEVRERDEQAVVQKQARVVEEVVVGKEVEQRTETVQDTVRRTDVDVEEITGQTGTGGSTESAGI